MFQITVLGFKQENSRIIARYTRNGSEQELVVDVVVVATGRKPNIETLNLENAGVEYGKDGILVNNELKTTADNIYAGPYHGKADCRNNISLSNFFRDREKGICEISEDKTAY